MDEQDSITYLPFHAINEFMRHDYRQSIIRNVLSAQSNLAAQHKDRITSLTRKLVQVPGFRNSVKAPIQKRIKPVAEAFVNSPLVTAAILSAWSDLHPALCRQVFEFLNSRGWEPFPIETDRTVLPGFAPAWPSGETFESIIEAYHLQYPESTAADDDVSLMVVWISMRLPYGETDTDDISPVETAE